MNRKKLFLLILLDLVFLGGVGFQLWNRYQVIQGEMSAPPSSDEVDIPILPSIVVETAVVLSTTTSTEVPAVPEVVVTTVSVSAAPLPVSNEEMKTRRTFIYHNPKAGSVQLVGDFNQWAPQSFSKKGSGRWDVSVLLSPGDYSYNFIVDGKVIRDRNQPRTDAKGRSLLTVAP